MCQETARSALPWDHAGRYSGTLSRLLRGNALEEQGDPHCQPWQHFAQRTLNSPISSGTHGGQLPSTPPTTQGMEQKLTLDKQIPLCLVIQHRSTSSRAIC